MTFPGPFFQKLFATVEQIGCTAVRTGRNFYGLDAIFFSKFEFKARTLKMEFMKQDHDSIKSGLEGLALSFNVQVLFHKFHCVLWFEGIDASF